MLIVGGQSYTFAEETDCGPIPIPQVLISAIAEPSNGGTVSGAGMWNLFSICHLTAQPAIGYSFDHWEMKLPMSSNYHSITEMDRFFNGIEISNHPDGTSDLTLPAVSPLDFKAVFNMEYYTLTYGSNDLNLGTVTGTPADEYPYDSPITLIANPLESARFVNWTETGTTTVFSTNSTLNIGMPNHDLSLTANFEPIPMRHVQTVVDPEGTAQIVGGNGYYPEGERITITVIPENGYWFQYYSVEPQPMITINSGIEPMKNSNYWSYPNSFEITVPSYDIIVTTHMYELLEYHLNLSVSPEGSGTAETSGIYEDGETVTMTATPNRGYQFVRWEFDENPFVVLLDGGSTPPPVPPIPGNPWVVYDNPLTLIMPWYDLNGTAIFEPIQGYNVETIADPMEGGNLTGAGLYYPGETYTLTATPNTGYEFVKWTWVYEEEIIEPKETSEYSTLDTGSEPIPNENDNPTLSDVMGERGVIYTAHFREIPKHNVTLIDEPIGTGTLSGSGVYMEGETYTISAVPNTGYLFSHWSWEVIEIPEIEMPVSVGSQVQIQLDYETDAAYTSDQATMTAVMGNRDITYTAHFVPVPIVNGTVSIHWTHNGMDIVAPETITGQIGTPYTTSPKVFPNYTLNETPANQNGVYVEGNIDVIYQYTYVAPEIPTEPQTEPVTEREREPQPEPETIPTTEPATQPTTVVIEEEVTPLAAFDIDRFYVDEPDEAVVPVVEVEEETVPLGDALPQTGQLPAELFYGLGGIVASIGVWLRKKR